MTWVCLYGDRLHASRKCESVTKGMVVSSPLAQAGKAKISKRVLLFSPSDQRTPVKIQRR